MKSYSTGPALPEQERVFVDPATYTVAPDGQTLVAYGLGACVAVAVYDPQAAIGGLAHAMLPRVADGQSGTRRKFVDAAVEDMVREMVEIGAQYTSADAWIVGGAELFALEDLATGIGMESVETARETLESLDIAIRAEAVGGDVGRTVEFDTGVGEVRVRTTNEEVTVL